MTLSNSNVAPLSDRCEPGPVASFIHVKASGSPWADTMMDARLAGRGNSGVGHMKDKQPMQADGQGGKVRHGDGVSEAPSGRSPAGESGGGAYPNPHHGKKPKNSPS